jgi:Flp pilus assembly protein TadG
VADNRPDLDADAADQADGERGAVLVEFALVFPILVMLLFGLLSGGMAWNQNLALSQGVRVGARYGATLPVSNYTTLDDYLDVLATRVVDASDGNVGASTPGRMVCVAYVHPAGTADLDKTRSRTVTGTTVTRSNNPCFTDSQATTDVRIQAVSERTTTLETGLWSRSITLHQQVVFRYEVSSGL